VIFSSSNGSQTRDWQTLHLCDSVAELCEVAVEPEAIEPTSRLKTCCSTHPVCGSYCAIFVSKSQRVKSLIPASFDVSVEEAVGFGFEDDYTLTLDPLSRSAALK